MGNEVGSIYYNLNLDDSDFKDKAGQASDKFDELGDHIQNLNPIMIAVGQMIADLAEKFISFCENSITETFNLGTQLEFVVINLDNLTGSASKTNEILGQMQDLVDKGLFKSEDIAIYTQKLIQMGVPQSNINSLMHGLAAAAVGSSSSLQEANTKMQGMTTMFGYITDKGGLTVSMLGRLSKSMGIPVIDAMAKSLGMTTDQFENLKGKTAVTADMLEKAFQDMSSGSGIFSKSIATDSDTMEAKQQALSEKFDHLKLSILGITETGDVIKGGLFDKISNAMSSLIDFLTKHQDTIKTIFTDIGKIITTVLTDVINIFKKVSDVVEALTKFYKDHKTIIDTVVIAIMAIIAQLIILNIVTGIVNIVMGIFGAIMAFILSPIGIVILVIAALIAIGYLLITHWTEVSKIANDVWKGVQKTAETVWDAIKHAFVTGVNDVIGLMNWLIDQINKIQIHIPAVGVGALKTPAFNWGGLELEHLGLMQYEQGGYVPNTGLAMLHSGEFVLSKDMLNGETKSPLTGQNINVYVDHISNDQDVAALAREIGFRIAIAGK